jgi:hypothetical protein
MKTMIHRILLILPSAALWSCASNLTLSDSIIFSEPNKKGYEEFRFIGGGSVSANVVPNATKYGTSIHPTDSTGERKYLNFNPGFGLGMGMASNSFAMAVSAQLLMIGLDITAMPIQNIYITGNFTSSESFSISCLGRINSSFAIGPFYRQDRFEGFSSPDFVPRLIKDARYSADSFGLKGILLYSRSSTLTQTLFVGVGYSPRIESIFVSFGVNAVTMR